MFSPCNFRGWGTFTERFSGAHGPNFTQSWRGEDIAQSFLHKKFVSMFRCFAAFSNADGSKLIDVENDVRFRTFWPPPVNNKGGVRMISIPIVEASPIRLNLRNTFDGHSVRGCWARCINKNAERKKEKKVHGQNLRPFRLTSGGLINIGIPGIVTCNKRRRRRAVWR